MTSVESEGSLQHYCPLKPQKPTYPTQFYKRNYSTGGDTNFNLVRPASGKPLAKISGMGKSVGTTAAGARPVSGQKVGKMNLLGSKQQRSMVKTSLSNQVGSSFDTRGRSLATYQQKDTDSSIIAQTRKSHP